MTAENLNNLFQVAVDSRINGGVLLEKLLGMKISPSRFQSILIELAQKVVEGESVNNLVQYYKENRFTKPCTLPQRKIIKLEELMYQNIPKSYADIELSPLAPLGVNSILTGISQRTVLSTVRNIEVLADPTTALCLECLSRLRTNKTNHQSQAGKIVNLSTSARCTRSQLFSKDSGFIPHFKVFALASGCNGKNETVDNKITEHLGFFLSFFDAINNNDKYFAKNVCVGISNINIMEKLISVMNLDRRELGRHSQDDNFDVFKVHNINLPTTVTSLDQIDRSVTKKLGLERHIRDMEKLSVQMDSIKQKYPNVNIVYDLARIAGIGYYNGICIKVTADNALGQKFPLVDGGYSNWLAKLTTNKKASFCSSGFGLELFGNLFKA